MAALSLDVHCALIEVIDLLEDCYFADIHAGEATIEQYALTMATQLGAVTTAGHDFIPERHEIVFDESPAPDGQDGEDLIQRLIYRADQPYRKEYSAIRYPAELNRRPGWPAAVGPYVSVVGGHPDFIENSVFVSAVQAVAAAAQLRRRQGRCSSYGIYDVRFVTNTCLDSPCRSGFMRGILSNGHLRPV